MKKVDFAFIVAAFLAVGLPLVGVVADGRPVGQYTEFPPLTMHVQHAGFSWPVFIGLAVFVLAVIVPFLWRIFASASRYADSPLRLVPVSFFPWWGWAGVLTGCVTSVLAWTRFEWFAPFQQFTFSPLWFSYILVVNALTFRRTGRCMLVNRTGYFLRLFPLSAAFWWFFEYLNRFVQNWYYQGVEGLSPFQYFIFATLPFSTVLPAVLGTYDLLKSFPRLSIGLENFFRLDVKYPKAVAWSALAAFGFGLAGIGVWPSYLFPLLWLSPLAIITAIQSILGRPTIFAAVRNGNWERIFLLAMSALVCGCFWEMWNFLSFAKWLYAVPFVGAFKVFEMPILGYAGYLPFGLECAVVGALADSRGSGAEEEIPAIPRPINGAAAAGVPTGIQLHLSAYTCRRINAVVVILFACYFFIMPGFLVMREVYEPDIGKPGVPAIALTMHKNLSPKLTRWARARVQSGKAGHLNIADVPSTEWPMFGCVFYLMATDNLQGEWEKNRNLSATAPREYAAETVDAVIDLVMDPVHHTWVKQHWGEKYMHRENVFFRSLVIRAITCHERITGNGKYLDVLRDQVLTLAADLDASRFGVLDDYPSECYPIDVFASIAWLQDAARLLGIDNSAFIKRSVRAFQGSMLDERGLPPFVMDSWTGKRAPADFGERFRCSRGTGNSWVLIFAPELWPDIAEGWYGLYEKYFWQHRWCADGFREFPNDMPGLDFTFDIDSGPIVAGFSPAANAFGVAMARANGRFDHAFTLTAQVLTMSWPLADGTLLGARILSNQAHAPYLGESAICYFLTQQPVAGVKVVTGGRIPGFVYIVVIVFYWVIGIAAVWSAVAGIRRLRCCGVTAIFPLEQFQVAVWLVLYLAAAITILTGHIGAGIIVALLAQFLPRYSLEH